MKTKRKRPSKHLKALHLLSEGLNVWGEYDWREWKKAVVKAFPKLNTRGQVLVGRESARNHPK
jgi:hypothetical protein